jgi:hypothetical protein
MSSEETKKKEKEDLRYALKNFLDEVEALNRPRQDIVASNILGGSRDLYGGDKQRRHLQKRWDSLKRVQPSSYKETLNSLRVTPSAATLLEVEEDRLQPSLGVPSNAVTSREEGDDFSSSNMYGNTYDGNDDDDDDGLANAFQQVSLSAPSTPPRLAMSARTPPRSASRASTPRLPSDGFLDIRSLIPRVVPNGTKKQPYIVPINSYAERHLGFNIERVKGIDHNSFTRKAWHIRFESSPIDYLLWKAFIPNNVEPEYENRLVMIEGPSLSYFLRNSQRYQESRETQCAATLSAHEATAIEIERDASRQKAYYLFVFPEETVLENHIFSGEKERVKVEWNKLTSFPHEKDNKFEVAVHGIVIAFVIAEAGGRQNTKESSTPDPKTFFSNPDPKDLLG